MGAVTQPWQPTVSFRALPLPEFATFQEPGYAKILWTAEVMATGVCSSILRTPTRVVTTEPVSRARFRRYWALFSPWIRAIRYIGLHQIKAEAERRARAMLGAPDAGQL
jgi:hypothetical protein